MRLEHYIRQGRTRLRCGYTTGSCAALAAKAATAMLLGQSPLAEVSIVTPKGVPVTVDLADAAFSPEEAHCAVRKDAGDDCDCTDGMPVYAHVARAPEPGVHIDGGEGVGRVTRPGLDQPVGAAAINRVPREMIAREVAAVCREMGYTGGISVVISIPGGAEAAAGTFNPRLGIEGGLSVLGTSGIVEPQSLQALADTVEVELRMLAAQGHRRVIATPGNYGEAFLEKAARGVALPRVKCSNFIGDTIDFCTALGYRELYLVGHMGKLVKLAAGMFNTHSRYGDGRAEIFAAHAGAAGAGRETVGALLEAATTDRCVELLDEAGLREPVSAAILDRALGWVRRRAGDGLRVELLFFSNRYGVLAHTPGAEFLTRGSDATW